MPSTLVPEEKLHIIADHYLQSGDLEWARGVAEHRVPTLPHIQQLIRRFVSRELSLSDFRHQLDTYLIETDDWGARGFWMMWLNQLTGYHGPPAEEALRQALKGLNATNVGQRIESFHKFIQADRERLKGKIESGHIAAPGRTAFIITMFANWLDPDGDVVVAWPSLKEGLTFLRDIGALPGGRRPSDDAIMMLSAQAYAEVAATIKAIGAEVPELTTSSKWWDERFLDWVRQHKKDIREMISPIVVPPPDGPPLPDDPLAAIPADRLRERITTLRRQLLVPEELIRRVYHTLVLGQHIILSGPPGTGKTELARILPRELWMGEEEGPVATSPFTLSGSPLAKVPTTKTTYAVRVVTATDEWTPRHVIGGIVPIADEEQQIRYEIAYGCLARTIMDNWKLDEDEPGGWPTAKRQCVFEVDGSKDLEYRGRWLVIDEFNRAPIDLALGDAMTALGGSVNTLNVPVATGTAPLPIPRDFRIIGTLNTFDRHFLNQISEALKRRFAFIEVLPPTRDERAAEQAMVLRKALLQLTRLSSGSITADGLRWNGVLELREGDDAPWEHTWQGDTAIRRHFEAGWRLFEVIRLYRQFGTAQAIAWTVNYLGGGLLDELEPNDETGWLSRLDAAFADILADQLQILFPDEVEVLLAYLRSVDVAGFARQYNQVLANLISMKRRNSQMLALQSVKDGDGSPYLSAADAQRIAADERLSVDEAPLATLFHVDVPRSRLPRFEGRMERFLFERVL